MLGLISGWGNSHTELFWTCHVPLISKRPCSLLTTTLLLQVAMARSPHRTQELEYVTPDAQHIPVPAHSPRAFARSASPPSRPSNKRRRMASPLATHRATSSKRALTQSRSSDSFALSDQECADVLRLMAQGSPKSAAVSGRVQSAACSGAAASAPLLDGFWQVHCEFRDVSCPAGSSIQGDVIIARCATLAVAEASIAKTLRRYPLVGAGGDHPPHPPGAFHLLQIAAEPPVFRASTEVTTEKWYLSFCKARIHADDAQATVAVYPVSPWRSLYQRHHVLSGSGTRA
jgi:hypothetical protein